MDACFCAMGDGSDGTRGIVLMAALQLLLLLLGIGAAFIPLASTEQAVVANHRQAVQLRYDAEAALERAIAELGQLTSWTPVRAGAALSALRASSSSIQLAEGTVLDVHDLTVALVDRGSGPDAVGRHLPWILFAHGWIETFMDAADVLAAPSYGVVWVADSPFRSGAGADASEALVLHAVAIGPRGGRRAVQATVRRHPLRQAVEVVSWLVAQ